MLKKRWFLLAPLALSLALVACKDDGDDDDDDDDNASTASASAEMKSKDGKVLGLATFTQKGADVSLVVEIKGAESKGVEVGLHIHEKPSCEVSADAVFTSAGDHWNPPKMPGDYGPPGASPNNGYLGELGKIALDAEGNGKLTFTSPNWQIGTKKADADVVGHAMILHFIDPDPNDGKNAPRQGCGVIAASK
ncbi:MAG TPA: superoxide dismutase family protein [Polyangiaceae bacterium]|nr:superoxide dismutase family protein [Polyangiaceae bacterium]